MSPSEQSWWVRTGLFGFLLGAAFQIQDDILNLLGDRQMVQAALDEFEVAYRDAPRSADRDFIRALIPYLGDRDL